MKLQNFEFFANTGIAVVGATVTPYAASEIHPNPNSPAAESTSTDTNGMWTFGALADGQLYDIKVEFGTSVKWYKGSTHLAVGHLYDDTSPDPNRNLIPNGGFDRVEFLTVNGNQLLPPSDPGPGVTNAADNWRVFGGTGDLGLISIEPTQKPSDSQNSIKVVYTRASGQAQVVQDLPAPLWQQLRGKQVSLAFQVFQEVASSGLAVRVDDGVGTTTGVVTSTVGAWTTIACTRSISPTATRLRVGVLSSRSDTGSRTFYVDNAMLDLGSVTPVFAPELADGALSTIYSTIDDTIAPAAGVSGNVSTVARLFSALANRIKALTGASSWRDAPAVSLAVAKTTLDSHGSTLTSQGATLTSQGTTIAGHTTQLATHTTQIAAKVGRSGDSMDGSLTVPSLYFSGLGPLYQIVKAGNSLFITIPDVTSPIELGPGFVKVTGALTVADQHVVDMRDVSSTPAVGKIPITGASGKLDAWITGGGGAGAHNHVGEVLNPTSLVVPGAPPFVVASSQKNINLNADMVDGAHASNIPAPFTIPVADSAGKIDTWVSASVAGATVPSGMIAAWPNSSAPSGWGLYTAANGRYLLGAGVTSGTGVSWTLGTNPGASWAHAHGNGSLNATVQGGAVGGSEDKTGVSTNKNGLGNGGGVDTPTTGHTHPLEGISFAVNAGGPVEGVTSDQSWMPPSLVVTWIQKT